MIIQSSDPKETEINLFDIVILILLGCVDLLGFCREIKSESFRKEGSEKIFSLTPQHLSIINFQSYKIVHIFVKITKVSLEFL